MKNDDILRNAVMVAIIREHLDVFQDLKMLADHLIPQKEINISKINEAVQVLNTDHNVKVGTDLFFAVIVHLFDPIQLFVIPSRKPNYKTGLMPFLESLDYGGQEKTYFLVRSKLAEVVSRFKKDAIFQQWVLNVSASICEHFNNRDY